MKLLEVRNLQTQFESRKKTVRVVDGVSFSVNRNETLAIVGESGSGKSMTSLSLMRLVPKPGGSVSSGEVHFAGSDLLQLPEEAMLKIRGKDIAMIFQEPMTSLNPVLTIAEQITETLIYHNVATRKDALTKASEVLEQVGFADPGSILACYPHQLSGGMRQRVMISMALSCDPQLLIADEPTTALDVTVQAQILDLMRDLVNQRESGLILITHDLGVVAELADRVVVMYAGQVVEEASVVELFDQPSHPYTQGLMESVPQLDRDSHRLNSIPGNVPSPDAMQTGCRFHTRCPHATKTCRADAPALVEVAPDHKVRCFLYTDAVTPREEALHDD